MSAPFARIHRNAMHSLPAAHFAMHLRVLFIVRSSLHSTPVFGASCSAHSTIGRMALLDSPSSTVARYTRVGVALHWAIAVALAAQFALGAWMLGLPKSPAGLRAGWFNVHKSIGITLALFVLLRIVWRAAHAVPQPDTGPAWQRGAALAVHRLLYVCMAVMPLTGFLGSSFTPYPIRYFGFVLPTPHIDWPAGKQLMSDVHFGAACLFAALIAVHVAAALWHWYQRDGVTGRMGIPSLR
jgi:cytochrome b561